MNIQKEFYIMNDEQKREIKQLLFVAEHYFSSAERLKKRISQEDINKTPKILKNENDLNKKETRTLVLFTSHLGSCAVRLTTIDDLLNRLLITKRRKDYYENMLGKGETPNDSNLKMFIHQLMRHNIAHTELDQMKYLHLRNYIDGLSFEKMHKAMDDLLTDIKRETGDVALRQRRGK